MNTLSRFGVAASLLAGSVFVQPVLATAAKQDESAQPKTRKISPYRTEKLTSSSRNYYKLTAGVDQLKATHTASGNLIRVTYRITDPVQAKPLTDRNLTPYLYGQRSRAVLNIPVMEKVGPLRQVGTPTAGKVYWMTFSNKGNLVKPGDRVNLIVGQMHIDGLMVE